MSAFLSDIAEVLGTVVLPTAPRFVMSGKKQLLESLLKASGGRSDGSERVLLVQASMASAQLLADCEMLIIVDDRCLKKLDDKLNRP